MFHDISKCKVVPGTMEDISAKFLKTMLKLKFLLFLYERCIKIYNEPIESAGIKLPSS